MVSLINEGVYVLNGKDILRKKDDTAKYETIDLQDAKQSTIAHRIISKHNISRDSQNLKIRFDALTSHDITFVGIVQTARASGLTEFPMPYVLTNCHNSLCAVGGTINEDDHVFGLSAAEKYGGIYVPAHLAVIHQYMREMMACCGSMILGSDSHTRYGALGTMAIGEGGGELVKQLLSKTYDIKYPEVVAVYLKGRPRPGVGPQDVALAIIGAVFKNGFVNNKILEFAGPGIENLSIDFRNGIDVMTTETTCLSSIWPTDEKVREYYEVHGRPECYKKLEAGEAAYYDGMVIVDLDKIECMIALPFHPSNVYTIKQLNQNACDILHAVEEDCIKQIENPDIKFSLTDKIVNGKLKVDQAIVAGCAGGTFENLYEMASMVDGKSVGNGYLAFSAYPQSQPVYSELIRTGAASKILSAGITMKTAFCGPCFGAGDVPANGAISIRHTTRNFPNREGSKPGNGQIASVALMDSRSITATALNGGLLTPATEMPASEAIPSYTFNQKIYASRVYNGFGNPKPQNELKFGPNIADWPKMNPLPENLLLKMAAVINDAVTTTDELIPSGETSSFRSNPIKLAEFTLGRKEPQYVGRAKKVQEIEAERLRIALSANLENLEISNELKEACDSVLKNNTSFAGMSDLLKTTGLGSVVYARKPGDGSAREQAASCQKVLGGWANIAVEYATKRYRSNLINWGMLPFTTDETDFEVGELIFIPEIRKKILNGDETITAQAISSKGVREIQLYLKNLPKDERDIILSGCLINYYSQSE